LTTGGDYVALKNDAKAVERERLWQPLR